MLQVPQISVLLPFSWKRGPMPTFTVVCTLYMHIHSKIMFCWVLARIWCIEDSCYCENTTSGNGCFKKLSPWVTWFLWLVKHFLLDNENSVELWEFQCADLASHWQFSLTFAGEEYVQDNIVGKLSCLMSLT